MMVEQGVKSVVHHYYYCYTRCSIKSAPNKEEEMRGAKKDVVLIRIVQSDYLN